jgi:hypothetical protein
MLLCEVIDEQRCVVDTLGWQAWASCEMLTFPGIVDCTQLVQGGQTGEKCKRCDS